MDILIMEYVHIIIEHSMSVPILVKKPLRVRDAKVFEMKEAVRVVLADQLDESMHEMRQPLGRDQRT